ncbi:MAG: hypothetical protein ACLQQ4_16460 [Bacteroidia bacterium]
MNTEWLKLRPFDGDIKKGFEELVCQLAGAEKVEQSKRFIRIAPPDAGIECYWILEDGKEIGWQAKFFKSMGESQWVQLDKSFKTALSKHPDLKKYIVAIPLDREDPKIEKQEWFMDKWNRKVKAWKTFAKSSMTKKFNLSL